MTCNREAASVEEAAQRWAGDVTVVGVAWNGTDVEYREFIERHGLTFPQIADTEAAVYDRFGIPIQPALVVIDASGEVQTLSGSVDGETLDTVFEAATT